MSAAIDQRAVSSQQDGGWSRSQVAIARLLLAGLEEEASRAEDALARGDVTEVNEAIDVGTRLLLRLERLHAAVTHRADKPCRAAGTALLLGAVHATRLRHAGLHAGGAFGPRDVAATA